MDEIKYTSTIHLANIITIIRVRDFMNGTFPQTGFFVYHHVVVVAVANSQNIPMEKMAM